VIVECLKPLKLTAAPRLALCRTELVGQLFTQHGFHDRFVTITAASLPPIHIVPFTSTVMILKIGLT